MIGNQGMGFLVPHSEFSLPNAQHLTPNTQIPKLSSS